MIERLLLFGATGDLVGRFLLPAARNTRRTAEPFQLRPLVNGAGLLALAERAAPPLFSLSSRQFYSRGTVLGQESIESQIRILCPCELRRREGSGGSLWARSYSWRPGSLLATMGRWRWETAP
jgi:hypothetical protein